MVVGNLLSFAVCWQMLAGIRLLPCRSYSCVVDQLVFLLDWAIELHRTYSTVWIPSRYGAPLYLFFCAHAIK